MTLFVDPSELFNEQCCTSSSSSDFTCEDLADCQTIIDIQALLPTEDQKDAMDNANAPDATNPFATMADVGGLVPYIGATSNIDIGIHDFTTSGAIAAGTFNAVAITAPLGSATLTISDSKTLTVPNDATVSGTNTGDQDLSGLAPIASPTFTGTVVLPSTTSIGNVSDTEIGYVDGVTSAIQTQLDSKVSELIITNRQVASYSLALSDKNKLVEMNVGSANNLTIPLDSSISFAIGTQILLSQYGAGQTTILPTGGVTLRSALGKTKLTSQYSGATLIKIATDEWYLFGDITT